VTKIDFSVWERNVTLKSQDRNAFFYVGFLSFLMTLNQLRWTILQDVLGRPFGACLPSGALVYIVRLEGNIRVCIQKFPDWVDNEIYAYLWYCSL